MDKLTPIRNLINTFGIKLDDFGRVTEEKVLDLPKEKPEVIAGQVVSPSMDQSEFDGLFEAIKKGGFEGDGIKYGRIGSLFDEVEGLNVNDAGSYETMITNLRQNNEELFQYLRRRKTLTIGEMVEMAEKKGVATIMKQILTMPLGGQLPAEDVVGGLLIIKRLMKEINYGTKKLGEIPDTPEVASMMPQLAEERRLQAKKVQILAGQLKHFSARLSASVTESARSLSVLANANKIFEQNLDKITQQADILFNEADPRLIDLHVVTLNNMSLDQRGHYLVEMADKAVTLSSRMISELYINSLLTSGVTHAVNIAGNATMQILRLGERGIAGGIGEARTQMAKLVGSEKARGQDYMDRAYMGEMAMGAFGDAMGLKDAFTLMTRAMLKGEASDLATKLDLRGPAIGDTNSIPQVLKDLSQTRSMGDFFNSVINIIGIAGRMPGRALLMEDEFFKGIIRSKTIYQEAYRSGMSLNANLAKLKKTNGDPKYTVGERAEMVQTHIFKLIKEPPENIKKIATEMAQKETFQGQVRPPFNYASGMFNNFVGKMFLNPFYKTPSNVFSEIGDRFIPHELIQAVKKGSGREFDEAMSKLVMGWGIMLFGANMVAGNYGDDVIITGAGPTSKRVQNIVGRGAEVPRGSIGVLNKETGIYEFSSFTRMDPVSMLLMMSADMHNYQMFENPAGLGVDPPLADAVAQKGAELTHALWLAISQHSTDLPFLQGISELNNVMIRGDRETGEEFYDKVVKFMGGKVGSIASNIQGQVETFSTLGTGTMARSWMEENYPETAEMYPIIPVNSLLRNIERVVSPESTSSMLNQGQLDEMELMRIEDIPPFLKGFYQEMNRAKGGHFLYSDKLEPQMNFWGEPTHQIQPKMIEKYGKWRFMYNPFQVMEGSYSRLEREFIRISEVTEQPFPNRYHRKRLQKNLKLFPKAKDNIATYELTAEEFNRNVYVANNIDANGRVKPNMALGIEGDDDFDGDTTMLNAMNDLVFESDVYAEADDDTRYKLLSTALSEYQALAKKWTFSNESRLIQLMDVDILDE